MESYSQKALRQRAARTLLVRLSFSLYRDKDRSQTTAAGLVESKTGVLHKSAKADRNPEISSISLTN